MPSEHPNVLLLKRLDIRDLATAQDLFAPGFVWHYYNPVFPDLTGDHVGIKGLAAFFEALAKKTNGTFNIQPVSVTAVGDELVFTQTQNTMRLNGKALVLDVAVVWRIQNGRISEVWDIVPTKARFASA